MATSGISGLMLLSLHKHHRNQTSIKRHEQWQVNMGGKSSMKARNNAPNI
jgi:hypothetical protein